MSDSRLARIDVAIRRLLPRKRALRSAGRGRGFSIAESDEYDALQAKIDALELEESALLLADDPANRSCCCGRGEGTKAMSEVERLMRERDDARAEVERLRVVVDAVCHEVAVTLQALAGGQVAGMPPLPPSVARRWARTLRELDGGDHD